MLSKITFSELFHDRIPFDPTQGQAMAMTLLADFICETQSNSLFLLQGYAGTGKTTLISALVKTLATLKKKTVLLAPTGRAAKVFSSYSQQKAFTIHKHIYRMQMRDGMLLFSRKENKLNNTLFIVDEVSMISDSQQGGELFSSRSLLEDLINYVFEGENNKLLFIGDDAQLPPVHADESPALMSDYLSSCFHLQSHGYQLTDVVRQTYNSGILYNANLLRKKIASLETAPPLLSRQYFDDFIKIHGNELEEVLNTLYNQYNSDEIVLITRSNKRAYIFNNEIRNRILFRENIIATGDYIMAVKNNYYWVDEKSEVGFIANGDIMEILAINRIEELYGFHFANVTVR
ncbi:MAG: AAA family ATPase, partial [Bacteroidales bacterium]